MSKIEKCKKCGQIPNGQGGEYPCSECGIPTVHDPKIEGEIEKILKICDDWHDPKYTDCCSDCKREKKQAKEIYNLFSQAKSNTIKEIEKKIEELRKVKRLGGIGESTNWESPVILTWYNKALDDIISELGEI